MPIHFRSMMVNQQLKQAVATDPSTSGICCTSSEITTRAQCSGIWIQGETNTNNCPTSSGCIGPTKLPVSGGCCYWKLIDNKYIQECKTCNNYEECLKLHQGHNDGLKFNFYPGQSCLVDGGPIKCNGVKTNTVENCNSDDYTDCYSLADILGNCCSSSDCSITTKASCSDVWIPPIKGLLSTCANNPCNEIYYSDGRIPPIANLKTLESSSNSFEKLPNFGEYYQGGIYVGVFIPGQTIVYGNRTTGEPSQYVSEKDSLLTSNGWILIADTEDFSIKRYKQKSETIHKTLTTFSDGLYNTDIPTESFLFENIKQYKKNGFTDWYLPSMDELALYFKNISISTTVYNNANLINGKYLSSTLFTLGNQTSFYGNYLLYTQNTNPYGQVLLTNTNYDYNIRLFRRIYLD